MNFFELGVPADLARALEARDIHEPFPIQEATIPDALAGRDVCGRAPTGSGKTLAFGIPAVELISQAKPRRPRCLVLAPTRELAAQIQRELTPLANVRDVRIATIYGGVGYEPQKKALRRGVEILVACPGRLRDLIDQNAVRLDSVQLVVIDEADRMADMGFLPEVRRLLDMTPDDRQTLLFSATLDGDVGVLQREYQKDPVFHEAAGVDEDAADVEHRFVTVEHNDRIDAAAGVILETGPTVVFSRTRHGAERAAKQLERVGVTAAAIHGGLSQSKRDRALEAFRKGRVQALVATDVAARGIHVDAVACVVHLDPPVDAKTYVHRSGRTARAGETGVVVSLITREQTKASNAMRRELGLPMPDGEAAGAPRNDRNNSSDRNARSGQPRRRRRPNRASGQHGQSGERSGGSRAPRAQSAERG